MKTYNVYIDGKVVATHKQPTAHTSLHDILTSRKNTRKNLRFVNLITK
jgi:hypothetical protein